MLQRLLFAIEVRLTKLMLESDSGFIAKFVNFEVYKKNFVANYMEEQGFGIPAITKVVLKNGFESSIAIHFFASEHMVIDYENGKVEPVYTQDLLQTEYYIREPNSE